ncbi:19087_t:CDS:2, partial [Dentiscutata erythropus]
MQAYINIEEDELVVDYTANRDFCSDTDGSSSLIVNLNEYENINSEDANIDLFERELNNEFLQINIEVVNMEMNNELAIEQFFDIGMFEQNQDIIENDQIINSQRPTSNTNED